jgi:hypothetical protein
LNDVISSLEKITKEKPETSDEWMGKKSDETNEVEVFFL